MPLSPAEIQRYKRHLLLADIGGQGQQRLKAARVLVIGAGGIGAPVLMYLAAAGVGRLAVIDDDTVSLDNLQRQIVHGTPDVGRSKVESAEAALARLNPEITVEPIPARLTADNAMELVAAADLVIDGSDNFATRYLAADACCLAARPLISAAVGPFDGHIATWKSYATAPDGAPYPTYRCLFPEPPPAGLVANCAENGVLGPVVGVLGTLAATEALKELTGTGHSLAGRLLIYDAKAARFESLIVPWDPDNPLTGRAPTIRDLAHHRAPAASTAACDAAASA